jgi:hypothetical protein
MRKPTNGKNQHKVKVNGGEASIVIEKHSKNSYKIVDWGELVSGGNPLGKSTAPCFSKFSTDKVEVLDRDGDLYRSFEESEKVKVGPTIIDAAKGEISSPSVEAIREAFESLTVENYCPGDI